MTRARALLASMKVGIVIVLVALAIGIAVDMLWGPLFGRYGWDVIAAGLMVASFFGMAALVEFARPQNPYRHLDPRFSYLDAAPTGSMESGSLEWLRHAVPPLLVALLIGLTHLVG